MVKPLSENPPNSSRELYEHIAKGDVASVSEMLHGEPAFSLWAIEYDGPGHGLMGLYVDLLTAWDAVVDNFERAHTYSVIDRESFISRAKRLKIYPAEQMLVRSRKGSAEDLIVSRVKVQGAKK